jgi:hypothetical protein
VARRADRLEQIRARRVRLIARAELQRDEIAREVEVWAPAIGVIDRGIAGYAWLRAHPGVLVAAGAVLLVLRPRRTLKWSLRLYSGWQTYRRLTALLARAAEPASYASRPVAAAPPRPAA